MKLHPAAEHEDVHADQAHVVGQWHPREAYIVTVETGGFGGSAPVGEDVGMRQHHAFRLARRAGGELNERDVVRLGTMRLARA